jgi:hypothetical protein
MLQLKGPGTVSEEPQEEEEEGMRNGGKPDTLNLMKTHMFMYGKLFYCAR